MTSESSKGKGMKRIWATPGLDELQVHEWDHLLAHLAKHRFVGIEPLIAGPYQLAVATIRELLQKHGLAITGLRTGAITMVHGVTLGHPDPSVRDEAIARLNEVTRYGSEFGQPRLLLGLMQGPLKSGQTVELVAERIIESLRVCADEAGNYGMEIDLEPVNRYELGYHNRVYEIIELIHRIDRPNVRILLDTFHSNIEEASISAAVVQAAPLMGHLHLADSNRLAPGQGHFPFAEFFALLKVLGYEGDVTIEARVPDPYEAISTSARCLDCWL
jgi:sugar phosphate isomerase/epimerase